MKFSIEWNGQTRIHEWIEKTNFDKLSPVKQISAFIFDEQGNICLIYLPNRKYWTLPGGTLEQGEDFEECLKREVREESDIEIKDVKPIGYFTNMSKDKSKEFFYQLRYIAKIKKINPQTKDPANDVIPLRKFVRPEEVSKYLTFKGTKEQLDAALKAYHHNI